MDSRKFWRLAVLPVIAAGALISATTVNANTLVAFGITYELTATGLNTSTAHFTLDISGINGAADTELGRYEWSPSLSTSRQTSQPQRPPQDLRS